VPATQPEAEASRALVTGTVGGMTAPLPARLVDADEQHRAAVERWEVPQQAFAGRAFWTRVNQFADQTGHQGHARMLVGHTDPTHRYTLRCLTCDRAVVDICVKRADATD
jgi:hypothetical protein